MLKRLLIIAITLYAFVANAQTVQQSGPVTVGHIPSWATTGVIQDGGSASIPRVNAIGMYGTGTPLCISSVNVPGILTGQYSQLCLGFLSGSGVLSVTGYGGVTPPSFNIIVNGNTLPIGPTGNLPLFTATTQGEVGASGGGTSSFLRADGSWATPAGGGNVTGPSSAVSGHFVNFNGVTGTIIKDSGFTPANVSDTIVPIAHGSFTSGDCVKFNDTAGTVADSGLTCGNAPFIFPPQGRLTLTTATPVMTADVTNTATVYYDTYIGNQVPIYGGSVWSYFTVTADEISLGLDSNTGHTNYHASGNLYDIFVANNSGITLCTGPAWSTTTARGTGASTTQLARLSGVLTNAVSMTCRFGNVSGNTFTCGVNQCTYLGTMLATANGQTGMQFAPSGASGGPNTVLALWNAYNRVKIESNEQDSAANWNASSNATWVQVDNSTSNKIRYVDGLAQSPVFAQYVDAATTSSTHGYIGVERNWAGGGAAPSGTIGVPPQSTSSGTAVAANNWSPSLGLNSVVALEWGTSSSTLFFGNNFLSGSQAMELFVSLEM